MLNLDHPMTKYVFQASGLMDGVMVLGQKMSVSPSAVRAELLAECLPLFDKMRELSRARFSKRAAYLLAAADEYEAAIRALAGLGGGQITEDRQDGEGGCPACGGQITDDRRDGEGGCPACGTKITKFRATPDCKDWIILCGECDKPFMAAYEKLDSSEGFSTCAI